MYSTHSSRRSKKFSLTCNVWSLPTNKSVLGVTAHWINTHFELQGLHSPCSIRHGRI
ncbi:uncharacterized protein VP01_160g7 [Puccinia sorghi]|uniref:Uncharacterized protein n=1 Tax=Puccinia sorghi TaxID=27349 RepID=A0A0L6VH95_9BASI|nr:uncharacterized protein VP01_160g7 [Puccinia sorghi]